MNPYRLEDHPELIRPVLIPGKGWVESMGWNARQICTFLREMRWWKGYRGEGLRVQRYHGLPVFFDLEMVYRLFDGNLSLEGLV